jgi:hypothetical protein
MIYSLLGYTVLSEPWPLSRQLHIHLSSDTHQYVSLHILFSEVTLLASCTSSNMEARGCHLASSLRCLAWLNLPIEYASSCIAVQAIKARKPMFG